MLVVLTAMADTGSVNGCRPLTQSRLTIPALLAQPGRAEMGISIPTPSNNGCQLMTGQVSLMASLKKNSLLPFFCKTER